MEHQADTVIGTEVQVKGNLHNKGSILVNGHVEGEIKSDENVTIGETATVQGPIVAKSILISGKVTGTIEAHERMEIDPTGTVNGDIKTKTMIVREGAVFNGNCVMDKQPKEHVAAAPVAAPAASEEQKQEEKKEAIKATFWDKSKK